MREQLVTIGVVVSLLFTCAKPARAEDSANCEGSGKSGPSNKALLAWGSLMGVADYFLGVGIHEGSHALGMKLAGGKVLDLDILPGTHNGHFYFGLTKGQGGHCTPGFTDENGILHIGGCQFTKNETIGWLIAPKISDVVIMGGYAALLETGNLPRNKYSALALTVLATGAWVDFSKDIFATGEHRDQPRFYTLLGADTERERIPYRLAHGALSAAAAIEIGRGYYQIFKNDRHPAGRKKSGSVVFTPTSIGYAGEF